MKQDEAKSRIFSRVYLDSLAVGDKAMVTKMHYALGNYTAEHTHPQEQCGYGISGGYCSDNRRHQYAMKTGDSYTIPGNVPHSFRVLQSGKATDVCTLHREDYL